MEMKKLLRIGYKIAIYLYWPLLLVVATGPMLLCGAIVFMLFGGGFVLGACRDVFGDHPTLLDNISLILTWLGIWLFGVLSLLPVFGVAAIFGWAKQGATAKGAVLAVYKWIVQIVCWGSLLVLIYFALK